MDDTTSISFSHEPWTGRVRVTMAGLHSGTSISGDYTPQEAIELGLKLIGVAIGRQVEWPDFSG